jgi:cytochrome c oxidase subunit 1
MSYARINNISLMLYIPGTILLIMSSIIDKGCAVGWTLYYPLSGIISNSSISIEYLILSIHILGISSILGGINFIITIMT